MVDRGLFDKKYHVALLGNSVVPTQNPNYTKRQVLDPSFEPGNWDVICHNSKEYQEHIGNRRFKMCVENHLRSYIAAPSRIAKSAIITNLVSTIRDSSTQPNGGFVRYDQSVGRWYEVGEKIARDKVGQALRDAARHLNVKQRKSSSSSAVSSSKNNASSGALSPQVSSMDTTDVVKAQHNNVQQIQPAETTLKPQDEQQQRDSNTTIERRETLLDHTKKKVILPISKKCFHFVHDRASSMTASSTSSSVLDSSSYKQFASDTQGVMVMPSSNTDGAAAAAAAVAASHDMMVDFRKSSSATVKGIGTADELLEWFEHDI